MDADSQIPADSNALEVNSDLEVSAQQLSDRYSIIELIGEGASSRVYKAEHKLLNQIVAIKLLKKTQVIDQVREARFKREARLFSKLIHPNIARSTGFGLSKEGELFMVMEYCDGISLESRLEKRQEFSEAEIKQIGIEASAALEFAHEHGIIHRDVKPGNIFLLSKSETGAGAKIKLLDFGLAKDLQAGDAEKLTKTSFLVGTPNYMSPEQCMSKPADARSDIYSLGCVLFECATMRKPFEADNDLELMDKHLRQKASFVSSDHVSAELGRIILKCLEKNPADRYQQATELKETLEGLSGSIENAEARRKRQARIIAASFFSAVAVLCGSLFLIEFQKQRLVDKGSALKQFALPDAGSRIKKYNENKPKKRLGPLSAGQLKEEGERARRSQDFSTAIKRLTEARALALRNPEELGMATFCLLELSQLNVQQRKFKEGKKLLLDCIAEAGPHGRKELLPEAYFQLGAACNYLDELDEAEKSYKKSISIASNEISAPRTLLTARVNLANMLFAKRDRLVEARKEYKLALKQLDENSDDSTIEEYLCPVLIMLCQLELTDNKFDNLNETILRLEKKLPSISPRYFITCLGQGETTAHLALQKGQTNAALRIADQFTKYPRQDELDKKDVLHNLQEIANEAQALEKRRGTYKNSRSNRKD